MTHEEQSQWMAQAIALARQAEAEDEVPVGALLVCDGKALAEGRNQRERAGRTLGHAELIALEHYNQKSKSWRLPEGATLFVTVEPCLMCTGAMISARVSAICFGCADTRNAGLSRVRPLIEEGVFDHRFATIVEGVRKEECSRLLSDYFRKKRGAL